MAWSDHRSVEKGKILMIVHHGELTLQAMMYIAKLTAEQKYEDVLPLGLRRDRADIIRTMTTEEIYCVALRIRTHFLSIHLDPDAFDTAVRILERRKDDEELDRALMRAGRPVRNDASAMRHDHRGICQVSPRSGVDRGTRPAHGAARARAGIDLAGLVGIRRGNRREAALPRGTG